MSLSENIKAKRQELKLSQEYVADQLGVSRQAVSKWETGRSEPTASNLVELASLFETSLSELVGPPSRPAATSSDKQTSKQILHTNLTTIAIGFQTGALHACTQLSYSTINGQKIVDEALMLFKLVILLFSSIWMARNIFYETDLIQRKKNSRIELLYCLVQLTVALLTLQFSLGPIGLLLNITVMFVYIFYINPKYMKRNLTSKRKTT